MVFTTLSDWSKHPNDSIRYYAGIAVYHNTFTAEKPARSERVYLNLGAVNVMARVKLTGVDVGTAWTAPLAGGRNGRPETRP